MLPEDVIFWVLREPGPSSLDLNLPTPSTEWERRFASHGSRTRRNPDHHPTQRCPFYHPPMNFCTETLNFTRRTWLCPGPGAALGCSRVPHGHHPRWGARGQANAEPLGLPSPLSHPGTWVLATRTLLSVPGEGAGARTGAETHSFHALTAWGCKGWEKLLARAV